MLSISSRTLLIPALSLACLLSACAGPIPKANPSEAWIGLQEETSSALLADKMDGKRLEDGRYFEVNPGAHRLGLQLYSDRMNEDQLTCKASISYGQFKAGENYKLVESSLGEHFKAQLMDSTGKPVAETDNFECMPG